MKPNTSAVYFCGTLTSKQTYCQVRVPDAGAKCRFHTASTDLKKLWGRLYRLCERVATVTGAAVGVAEVSKSVWPIIQQLGGLLMSEDFWYGGLQQAAGRAASPQDHSRIIRDALTRIQPRQARLITKLRGYSAADRARVLQAVDAATNALHELEANKTKSRKKPK